MNILEAFPPTRHAGPIANPGEAEQIARALKAQRSGKGWVAKCPAHDDRNASLSISEGEDRLLMKCFAGCEFNDILGVLQDRGIIGTDNLDRGRRVLAYIKPAPTEHLPDPRGMPWWSESMLRHDTFDKYCERRAIPRTPPSLRYNASIGAMLAGFQRPDGKLVGLQATFLTPDGNKVKGRPRLTYTEMRDGAVRLAAAAEIMGLSEGVETGLSAMAMTGVPVWVALGKRLDQIALPEMVREVHLFADNDQPGREAADRAAEKHLRAGRAVEIRFPLDGLNDWNDLALALADCDGDNERLRANLAAKIGGAAWAK